MDLGSIHNEGTERVILISTTLGFKMSGIKALIKTVEIYKILVFTSHFRDYGNKFITGKNSISKHLGVEYSFSAKGFAF